jgi:hypothetical protein
LHFGVFLTSALFIYAGRRKGGCLIAPHLYYASIDDTGGAPAGPNAKSEDGAKEAMMASLRCPHCRKRSRPWTVDWHAHAVSCGVDATGEKAEAGAGGEKGKEKEVMGARERLMRKRGAGTGSGEAVS